MEPKDVATNTPNTARNTQRTCLSYTNGTETSFACGIPYQLAAIKSVVAEKCTWKRVFAVALDAKALFCPGDSVGIMVPNAPEMISRLVSLCSLQDAKVRVERSGRHGFLYTGTLFGFFLNHFDFVTLPKKSFLSALATTSDQRERLEYLCTKEGANDYFGIFNSGSNLLDVISAFGCKPSAETLVQHCEIIKPRFFSLTNHCDEDVEFLVGIMPGGHVSGFVQRSTKGDAVRWYVKENRLLRMTSAKKMLCICAGTGIAPFYSFAKNKTQDQEMWLVFGCRNTTDDLSTRVVRATNVEVSTVFSSQGKHVLDVLTTEASKVAEFVLEGCVFVCGPQQLQSDVVAFFALTFGNTSHCIFVDDWH